MYYKLHLGASSKLDIDTGRNHLMNVVRKRTYIFLSVENSQSTCLHNTTPFCDVLYSDSLCQWYDNFSFTWIIYNENGIYFQGRE